MWHILWSKRLVLAATLTLSLVANLWVQQTAHADISVCRSDPTISLSNGAVVSLGVNVADTTSDLQHITYTLYAPVGTRITGVTYTKALGSLESVVFSPTMMPSTYRAGALVSLNQKRSAAVTAVGSTALPGGATLTGSATGTAGTNVLILMQ